MTTRWQRRKLTTFERARQREAEERLAPFGFGRGLRVHTTGRDGLSSGAYGRGLRRALEGLGPVFSAFGLYLSSRVDLLSPQDCLELAQIADAYPAMPGAAARTIVMAETGRRERELFREFDDTPFQSRLAWQSHRARLADGRLAEVRVLRPEFESAAAEDAAFFSCDGMNQYDAALGQFSAVLQRRLDLRVDGQGLARTALDARGIDGLAALTMVPECTGARVLTTELLWDPAGVAAPEDREEAARRLCLVWLRQTLYGRVFAVDPRRENIAFLPRGMAFLPGEFDSMPAEAQPVLWEYLNAAAADDPDRVASCLLSQMVETDDCAGPMLYTQRLRQIVPFRDGGWAGGAAQSLAEHLFHHWKLALDHGYRPQPHLLQFWRGLFVVSATAHSLSPGNATLLGALKELQTIRLLNRMQEFLNFDRMGDRFDRYCYAAMEFPRRTNEILTAAESGNLRLNLRPAGGQSRKQNQSAVMAVLLLLLAATAIWGRYLGRALPNPMWAERIVTVVFLVLGGALLRLVLGSR